MSQQTPDEQDEQGYECPYCGSTDGEPITAYSREYQGESPHGGWVEWQDERCTSCYSSGEPEYEPELEMDRRF